MVYQIKMNEENTTKKEWYDRYYKIGVVLAFLLMFAALGYIAYFYYQTGDIMHKDVGLTGGTILTVNSDADVAQIEKILPPGSTVRKLSDITTGKQVAFSVETAEDINKIKPIIERYLGYNLTEENSSAEFTGSTLSASFYKELRTALFLAYGLMAIVVFFLFRTFVPSIAVLQAGFTDIIVPLAILDLTGFQISGAGIASFLMLIGYSVDTDILLTNRALRKKELTINQRIWSAFLTGMTMTLTALIAITLAYFVVKDISSVLSEIFLILILGLVTDIFSTWVGNAAILKWYCEKKRI
jgi:preprotein translocase subunit SecF